MRSKFEAQVLADLDARKVKYEYEPHYLPYLLEMNYLPDLKIGEFMHGQRVWYAEIKGHFKAADRRKMLAVKRAHPEADIRFVFMRAGNKISKVSKTTYAAWAEKHGFPWAEGTVPKEWIA